MTIELSWLDRLQGAVFRYNGADMPQRGTFEFVGGGVSLADNAALDKTVATITSGGGGLIVNADVSPSAAIDVTKLAAGSTGQVLTTVSGYALWVTPAGGGSSSAGAIGEVQVADGSGGFAAPGNVRAGSEFLAFGTESLLPATGSLRFAPGSGFATVRNISNSDDKTVWKHEVVYGFPSSKEHLYVGCHPGFLTAKSYDVVHQNANDLYDLRISGTTVFTLSPTESTLGVAKTTWGPANAEVVSALPESVVSTFDATPTPLVSLPLDSDSVYDVLVTVVGKRTASTGAGAGGGGTAGDCYRADFSATYQRIGSAAPSLVGAAPVETNKKTVGGGAAYAASLATSSGAGSSLVVTATGVASTGISWSALVQMQRVF